MSKSRSRNVAMTALKVSSRVLYEKLARPMAREASDVPRSPDAITPEWLTAVLCTGTPGAAVTDVKVETASAGTHERHRLRVSYNEAGRKAGLPASIFTKSLPSIVTRMIAGFNGHARVEGRFYSEVRPLLTIEAPVCYHSTYDRQTFAAIHLLEDLVATKAATFCGHKTNVTRVMAEDMVDLLASSARPILRCSGVEGVSLARRLSALVQHRRRKDADRALYAKGARCCGIDHSLKTDRATERDLAGDHARACGASEPAQRVPAFGRAHRQLVPERLGADGPVRLAMPLARTLVARLRLRGQCRADASRTAGAGNAICWPATSNASPGLPGSALISTKALPGTASNCCMHWQCGRSRCAIRRCCRACSPSP